MRRLLVFFLSWVALYVSVCAAGNWVPASAAPSPELMQQLSHAHWIASAANSPRRTIYVFSDPNCPYCNDLWKALQAKRVPEVQIRYLLVAVIDADSRAKDAAILESADPIATLDAQERSFAHGGIAGKTAFKPATNGTIAANQALMDAFHIYATPGLVYVDEHKEARVFVGMPNPEQLETILGKH